MNRGAHDDPLDYGDEVPGHGPTVIVSHLDGDETVLPRAVEHRLRCGPPARDEDEAVWQRFRDLERSLPEPPLPFSPDDYGTDDEEPVREPRPTVVALVACVLTLLAAEFPLVALRVGGALDWSWGWVLAPLWVPVTVATLTVAVACVWLAAMDERDAARRRNRIN